MPKSCVRACKDNQKMKIVHLTHGSILIPHQRSFSLHARTQVFWFFSHIFHFTETLRTIGRVSTHPAHSTQCLRATGRAGRCPAPTRLPLLNQRNLYADHAKRSRQKSSERKQKTPTGRGGTLGRPPRWRKDGYCYFPMKIGLKPLAR